LPNLRDTDEGGVPEYPISKEDYFTPIPASVEKPGKLTTSRRFKLTMSSRSKLTTARRMKLTT
jgi:hypothetical protein